MQHAKPITVGELERILGLKSGTTMEQNTIFQEVIQNHNPTPIDPKLPVTNILDDMFNQLHLFMCKKCFELRHVLKTINFDSIRSKMIF